MTINRTNAERLTRAALPTTANRLMDDEDELRDSLLGLDVGVPPAPAPVTEPMPVEMPGLDLRVPPEPEILPAAPVDIETSTPPAPAFIPPRPTPTSDREKAINRALDLMAKEQLAAGIMRGAETISSAIGRQKPDYTFSETLRKEAEQPLATTKLQLEQAELSRQEADKARLEDPNSPESKALRKFITSTKYGQGIAGTFGKEWDNLSYTQLRSIPGLDKILADPESLEKIITSQQMRDASSTISRSAQDTLIESAKARGIKLDPEIEKQIRATPASGMDKWTKTYERLGLEAFESKEKQLDRESRERAAFIASQRKEAATIDKAAAEEKKNIEKRKTQMIEIEDRYQNIKKQVAELKDQIKKKGTYETVGPENAIFEQKLTSIATDMAKLVDPESVARESEVAAFKQMLVKPTLWTRNKTAIATLDSFSKLVDDRLKTAYKVRGLDQQFTGSDNNNYRLNENGDYELVE